MSLTERLEAATAAKVRKNPIYTFLQGLSEKDRKSAWAALRDEKTFKRYPLYNIFREEGLRVSKETFTEFRKAVLEGTVAEGDVHGAE